MGGRPASLVMELPFDGSDTAQESPRSIFLKLLVNRLRPLPLAPGRSRGAMYGSGLEVRSRRTRSTMAPASKHPYSQPAPPPAPEWRAQECQSIPWSETSGPQPLCNKSIRRDRRCRLGGYAGHRTGIAADPQPSGSSTCSLGCTTSHCLCSSFIFTNWSCGYWRSEWCCARICPSSRIWVESGSFFCSSSGLRSS